jgi:predicted aspartyl protease
MIHGGREKKTMGRFSVEFEVANNDDLAAVRRGALKPSEVRRLTVAGVVDSGATNLVLPKRVMEQLGLPVTNHVKVKYADGRVRKRPAVQGVYLSLQGRDSVFSATVEPKRDTALIGAIVLETLDFLVDNKHKRLVPRDPDYIVNEIE